MLNWAARAAWLRIALLNTLLATAFATGLVVAADAQPYPSRPIKMIVPFPPGGPIDVMARVVVQRLSVSLGQVIIDNRPGAGGTLGSRAAAMAEPDGYTLLFGARPRSRRHRRSTPMRATTR